MLRPALSLQEIQKVSLLVAPFLDVLACSVAGAVRFAHVKRAANIPGDPPEPQSILRVMGAPSLPLHFPLPVSQAQGGGKGFAQQW